MLQIQHSLVPGGVVVIITGRIADAGVASTVVDGLASLGDDGDVIVDISGLILETPAVAVQLCTDCNHRLRSPGFRVVCCDNGTRTMLLQSGMDRHVFPTVVDALVATPMSRP
jgi:hypothetical protein